MFVIYACHGITKEGEDLGQTPSRFPYGESYSNSRIAAELYSRLSQEGLYGFLPRPAHTSICRERFEKVAALGSVVVEIHTHEDVDRLRVADSPIDSYCLGASKPVVTFVCPFSGELDARHFQKLAWEITETLKELHPELWEQAGTARHYASIPPCREGKQDA